MVSNSLLTLNYWIVEITTVACYTTLFFISGYVSRNVFSSYNSLSIAKKVEWDSRVVSTINAFIITGGACILLFSSPVFADNPFVHASFYSHLLISILWGYFFYDACLILFNRELLNAPTLTHHLLGVFLFGIGKLTGSGHYLLLIWATTEATTPFVNQRWFFYVSDLKESNLYIINGILMAVGFLLLRTITIPALSVLALTSHYADSLTQVRPFVRYSTYAGISLIFLVNCYWTLLIWRGLIKTLSSMRALKNKKFTSPPSRIAGTKEA